MDIISRKEAKEKGLQFYFTGKQCKRGHVSKRTVSGRACAECLRINSKSYYNDNREEILTRHKEYNLSNREEKNEYYKKYYRENKESKLEYSRGWYQRNREAVVSAQREYYIENREHKLESQKRYREENPDKRYEQHAKRRAARIERTVLLGESHVKDMAHMYQQAALLRYLGYDVHVDHIIPLQGEVISGLHVPWNLQILSRHENLAKGNSFVPYVEIYD